MNTTGLVAGIMWEELPCVNKVWRLCQDIYMCRESKEFELEEELIAKLTFLYRSPETMIKITRRPKEDWCRTIKSFTGVLKWDKKKYSKKSKTRQSSCVNARGIPTAAYQVLHLLPEVGYPPGEFPTPPLLARSNGGGGGCTWGGVPPQPGLTGGRGRWGTPPSRVPPARSNGAVYPRWVTPLAGYPPARYPPGQVWWGEVPEVGTPWPGLMGGTPQLGSPPRLDLAGVPPPLVDRQNDGWTDTCENITFPSYYVRGR